jgi:hypothetical protein
VSADLRVTSSRRLSLPPVPRSLAALLAGSALLFVNALPVVAQDPSPLLKLDQQSQLAIEVLIDSAVSSNLPTRSLTSKALEGVSKKADGRRIVAAVRRQLALLRTAHQMLGGVDPQELEAAAAVLEAGAKPDQLTDFKLRQRGRSDLVPFTVWADFLARGVPKDDASSAITKLWQDGADDLAFRSLWLNVQADILQGLNPGTALQNRIRETPGRSPSTTVKPPEGPQENQSSR